MTISHRVYEWLNYAMLGVEFDDDQHHPRSRFSRADLHTSLCRVFHEYAALNLDMQPPESQHLRNIITDATELMREAYDGSSIEGILFLTTAIILEARRLEQGVPPRQGNSLP